jgi:tRNA A-37 threonylcarbamoyl transferase component Bud32
MTHPSDEADSISKAKLIDAICDRFEEAWLRGERLAIEQLIADGPWYVRSDLSRELAALEIDLRRKAGELPEVNEYAADLTDATSADPKVELDRTNPIVPSTRNSKNRLRYFGDFELLEEIASGGMGTVYRARQLSLDRIVAVKMIKRGRLATDVEVRRFYSEAKAAASLDHPSIVPVYEVGEFEGDHFYSMAYVEGQSLADKLKLAPLEARQAAELMQSVALAVHYAHEQGVIHRDLKPSNILLDSKARPRVTDFGLAKQLGDESGLTLSGEILGTPSFMAPEQAVGHVQSVGYAADVYSLGAVLYTCVAGRPPFQAASQIATLKQVIENDAVLLRQLNSAVPRDLETIVHKCLDKSIHRRYRSAFELANDLGRFLSGEPIQARPVHAFERLVRWCRRHPAKALNIISAIALLLIAYFGWVWMRVREQEILLQDQAASAVEQLQIADESELPTLVGRVRQLTRARSLLRAQFDSAPAGSATRYRAALGLLPGDDDVMREVGNAWIGSDWSEWVYIRNQLTPETDWLRRWIREFDADTLSKMEDDRLSRFIAILAAMKQPIVPEIGLVDSDWERITASILTELLKDPTQLPHVAQAFAPIRAQLIPRLTIRTDYQRKDLVPEASVAASLIADFYGDDYGKLIDLGAEAKSQWLPVLLSKVRDEKALRDHLQTTLTKPIAQDSWLQKIRDCRRRAFAATALFRLGDSESIWPLLFHREDTTVRALIIDWMTTMQPDPSTWVKKARLLLLERQSYIAQVTMDTDHPSVPNPWLNDDNTSLLRAVLKALGNYPPRVVQRSVDESFWNLLAERFELDPDPGVHSSCEWLLRVFNRKSILELHSRLSQSRADRTHWLMIGNDHLMIRLKGPISYQAGSDPLDPYADAGESIDPVTQEKESWSEDVRIQKQIPRNYMIAAHETRLSQMQTFDPDFHILHNKTLAPTLDHPACRVSWHKAAAYCNWLSKIEAIPKDQWCFIESSNGEMQVAPDYLQRQGYRLPSEAEWEFACRAGTLSRTYFGDSEELLLSNVWFIENSREKILMVPGSLKPNGLGLFDTLGNVQEWCMDGFQNRNPGSRARAVDLETPLDLNSAADRIMRGSSIYAMCYDLRASEYSNFRATYREGNSGFRIARTVP